MAPFRGLFEPVPLDGRSLIAMIVYGIVALGLHASACATRTMRDGIDKHRTAIAAGS